MGRGGCAERVVEYDDLGRGAAGEAYVEGVVGGGECNIAEGGAGFGGCCVFA